MAGHSAQEREAAGAMVDDGIVKEEASTQAPILAGWLHVLDTSAGGAGGWQPLWCTLRHSGLALHAQCGAPGALVALSGARVLRLADPTAPVAASYRLARPHGLLLEPADGHPAPLLLDAGEAAEAEVWLAATSRVITEHSGPARLAPQRMRAHRASRAIEIDDFSDYEDNENSRKFSIVGRHEDVDWAALAVVPPPVEEPEPATRGDSTAGENFDIDDFSDYEDDEHARQSSIVAIEESDWAALKGMALPELQPGHSDEEQGASSSSTAEVY